MHFPPPTTSYQEIPYANDPYRSSHPDQLATVARLAGLASEPADGCRVLELGCARGGNLIPMALGLPRSRFVGIDSSPSQVAQARELIGELGLSNIVVEARNILDLDHGIGSFDYIICHGTFSWVPTDVQDKILEIAAGNLTPNGVAYISYNTYPGWHLRGLVREMMCYHVRRYGKPQERASEARSVLRFMTQAASHLDPTYGGLLNQELEYISQRRDSYLLHDHLETVNDPIYFHEFIDRARSKGLRFVSEVQDNLVAPESLAPAVSSGLRALSADDCEFEQFVDFLINRKFRQSVLCHAGNEPRKAARPEDLVELYVASTRTRHQVSGGFRAEALCKAALDHLNEIWPRSVSFRSLLRAARSRIGASPDSEEKRTARDFADLSSDLLRCYTHKLAELSTLPPSFVLEIGEKPVASALARLQARAGSTVTNLRHEAGQLSEFGRHVVRCLDGHHDRPAILYELIQSAEDGRIVLPRRGSVVPRPSSGRERPLPEIIGEMLDDCLKKIARFALLVA